MRGLLPDHILQLNSQASITELIGLPGPRLIAGHGLFFRLESGLQHFPVAAGLGDLFRLGDRILIGCDLIPAS